VMAGVDVVLAVLVTDDHGDRIRLDDQVVRKRAGRSWPPARGEKYPGAGRAGARAAGRRKVTCREWTRSGRKGPQ
jgi:hypothetical protein